MSTRDEWHDGFAAGAWSSDADRDRLLRFAARAWSPERLEGFLAGYDVARRPRCTCGDCPQHSGGERPSDPLAS